MNGEWDGFCRPDLNLNSQLGTNYGFPTPLPSALPTAWPNPYQLPNPASFTRQF
ncbi:MAG: hypothetical protein VKM98_04815 [Cyanobacteriota bacterium]|nr:hypothetical protein [Cyanobacteriota bacterium]